MTTKGEGAVVRGKQIPFGDDSKKYSGNGNDTADGHDGLFVAEGCHGVQVHGSSCWQ